MAFDAQVTEKSADMIVLEKARARIARGWCQSLTDENGAVCIVGALKSATSADGDVWGWAPGQMDTVRDLLRIMGFAVPDNGDTTDASTWNDRVSRRKGQVLARFDAAIAKLAAAR